MPIRIYALLALFALSATMCSPATSTPEALAATPVPVSTSLPVAATEPPSPIPVATATITATPRLAGSDYPLVNIAVQAIRVADDDGERQATITPEQVRAWVDKASEIYAVAGIRFLFDPQKDVGERRSTLLNNIAGPADARWLAEADYGDEIAAQYPGKLVVFFHHGPGDVPASDGLSWHDYNFAIMPGWDASICGAQNIGLLAQVIGHYLGLQHTFPAVFATKAEAESYFKDRGSDPAIFDGDGFSDTAPDPYIQNDFIQCDPVNSIQMDGAEFHLPRGNIMSRYASAIELSPQQILRARSILALRMKNGMVMPSNHLAPRLVEAESLAVLDQVECAPEVQNMSPWGVRQWSRGQQFLVSANRGGMLSLALPVAQAGRYQLNAYLTYGPNY
ncbi:MAG: hypothetical protein EHM81_14815, partial [Chloroflexi bacterium]